MRTFSFARWATGALLLLGLAGGKAQAQRTIVGEVAGGSDEAGAVSLLLRSMVGGQRPAVHVDELARVLARMPDARAGALIVDPAHAEALMRELGADRLIVGELKSGSPLMLSLQIYGLGAGAAPLAEATVQAAPGELAALAKAGAERLAKEGGVDISPFEGSLGDLRPFVRASRALVSRDLRRAAEELKLARRGVATRVPAAKEVADLVWRDPGLATDLRIAAALAADDAAEAVRLGQADSAPTAPTRAAEAEAQIAAHDVKGAEKTLAQIKGKDAKSDDTRLARAELDLAENKKDSASRELSPLLNRKPPSAVVLSVMAALPPNALSKTTEMQALAAAESLSGSEPGVASAVGMRAVRGGEKGGAAVGLIKEDDLGPMDLSDVDKLLDGDDSGGGGGKGHPGAGGASGSPQAKALSASIAARRGVVVTELKNPSPAPAAVEVPVRTVSPEVQAIASQLTPLLNAFAPLTEGHGTLAIHPMTSGQPPWMLYTVHRLPLEMALEHALSSPPYHFLVTRQSKPLNEHSSAEQLTNEASAGAPADFVLLYKCTSTTGEAHVWLTLYVLADGKLYQFDEPLAGDASTLTRLNPALFVLGALVLLGLVSWVFAALVRVGEVNVEVKRDPGAENEIVIVLISRRPAPPPIVDVGEFHRKGQTAEPSTGRLRHYKPTARTTFPRVPVGKHWVHVYGSYEKGGEVRELPKGISKPVVVKRKEAVAVKLELDPNATEHRVSVVDDDKPVANAILTVDNDAATRKTTDARGNAVLHITRGEHHVKLETKELTVTRRVDVAGGKVVQLVFDLVRERRNISLSGGIAIADYEAGHPLAKKRAATPSTNPEAAHAESAPAPAPRRSEPEDDGISLPPNFGSPEPARDDGGISLPAGFSMPALADEGVTFDSAPPAVPVATASKSIALAEPGIALAEPLEMISPAKAAPTVSPPAPPSISASTGRFTRQSERGRGSAATVYTGRDNQTGQPVAIKVMAHDVATSTPARDAFVQDGRRATVLRHANLVAVLEQSASAEAVAVMELVEAPSLATRLSKGALPVEEVLAIGEQLCLGLAQIHAAGLVHRDLKPANLFWSGSGLKIGDVGIGGAVQLARRQAPLNAAPEQLDGQPVDERSDLYAVGCCLFALACGRSPFEGADVKKPAPKPSSINRQLDADFDRLVAACLVKDPDARVGSAGDLRNLIRPLKARYS